MGRGREGEEELLHLVRSTLVGIEKEKHSKHCAECDGILFLYDR